MSNNGYKHSKVIRRLDSRSKIERLLGLPDSKQEREHKNYEEVIKISTSPEEIREIKIRIKFSRYHPTRLCTETKEDLERAYSYIIMQEL